MLLRTSPAYGAYMRRADLPKEGTNGRSRSRDDVNGGESRHIGGGRRIEGNRSWKGKEANGRGYHEEVE